jgi:tripartite-type tricarboxylate transporter receptor subunit TctC
MGTSRRNFLAIAAISGTALSTLAQEAFPVKPIRWVVPWVAGTPGDFVARIVGEQMAKDLGQPIVIENKAGATGTAAIPEVLRQPADGYTLYYLGAASLLGPMLYPNANIDFASQFSAVGGLDTVASVVVVGNNKPYENLADLIAAAKAKGEAMTYASAGNGSPPHLVAEMFKQSTGVKISHIPYAQVGQAMTDVISGRVDLMFLGAPLAIQQVNGGKMRALAVTSAKRMSQLPNVPTVDEAGIKGFAFVSFDGILVRRGTPDVVIQRLSDSLQKALASAQVRDAFAKSGLDVLQMNSSQFSAFMNAESSRFLAAAKAAGIRID